MRNYTYPPSTLSRPVDLIPHILAAVVGGLAIFTMLLAGIAIGFNMYYAGRVYPGVTVAGVDLSGLRPEETAAVIEERLDYPARGRILLRDGENMWLGTANQGRFYLDPQATALSAYRLGRGGNPLARLVGRFGAWYLG